MTVAELRKELEEFPDDAKVYAVSDHGQCPEPSHLVIGTDSQELPYNGEEIDWTAPNVGKITAICIG